MSNPKTETEKRHLLIGAFLLQLGRLRPERETALAALKELGLYAAHPQRYRETVEHCGRMQEEERRRA